jgi:hypothetical protein
MAHTADTTHIAPIRLGVHSHLLRVLGMILVCGWIDYLSGYELTVALIYAVPIVYARQADSLAGLLTALLCAITWAMADVASGHVRSSLWLLGVDLVHRLAFFSLVSVAASHALPFFGRSDPVHLRHCTQCPKIEVQRGDWAQPSAIQTHHVHQTRPSVCPDCARHAYARAGYRH